MTSMTQPTLIFDLDGTLVDTAPDLLAAANAVLAARDRPAIDPATLHHMIGFGARSLIAQALPPPARKPGQKRCPPWKRSSWTITGPI